MQKPYEPRRQPQEAGTLIVEDRLLASGFIQLPKLVLHAADLSRDAKLLYAILLSYAWQADRCFPGYRRLCQDMQASENMVRKYMRELMEMGLLSQIRRGLGRTNIYTLHDVRTAKIAVQKTSEIAALESSETAGKEEAEEQETYLRNSRVHTKTAIPEKAWEQQTIAQSTQEASYRKRDARAPGSGPVPVAAVLAARLALPDKSEESLGGTYHSPSLQLRSCISEFGTEFGDRRHHRANLAQAGNLLTETGASEAGFIAVLYEARAITRDRQHARDSVPLSSPMAYFWRVVRDLLGLTAQGSEASSEIDRVGGPIRGQAIGRQILGQSGDQTPGTGQPHASQNPLFTRVPYAKNRAGETPELSPERGEQTSYSNTEMAQRRPDG